MLDLVVKGAVGGFLRLGVFLLIPHTDEHCGVDVHADQLLSLQDVHAHLIKQQSHLHSLTIS